MDLLLDIAYLHATAVCMDSHVSLPKEAFVVQNAPERTIGVDASALVNAALYLHKILKRRSPALVNRFQRSYLCRLRDC